MRLKLGARNGAGSVLREIQDNPIRYQPLQGNIVERGANGVMGGRVDMCANVIDEMKLRHAVAINLHARKIMKRGARQPWIDGHIVGEMMRKIDDAQGKTSFCPECGCVYDHSLAIFHRCTLAPACIIDGASGQLYVAPAPFLP